MLKAVSDLCTEQEEQAKVDLLHHVGRETITEDREKVHEVKNPDDSAVVPDLGTTCDSGTW